MLAAAYLRAVRGRGLSPVLSHRAYNVESISEIKERKERRSGNMVSKKVGRYLTSRSSRESTESPEPEDANTDTNTGTDTSAVQYPRLEFRFSQGRHGGRLLAGRDQSQCHVLLVDPEESGKKSRKAPKVSSRHFILTYKKIKGHYHLVLQDESTLGTVVTYNGSGGERRRDFTWIVGGGDFVKDPDVEVIVKVDGGPSFKIVAAKHNIRSPTYTANVERFLKTPAITEHFKLHLGGQDTGKSTGTQTPSKQSEPLRLERELLGVGSFGTVTRCWDVSTAEETARKSPNNPNKYKVQDWRNEKEMMERLRHPHIVRLVQAKMEPLPQIWLEYLPEGNLKIAHKKCPLTEEDRCLLVLQAADALEYLHGENAAHRDIKFENILVADRDLLHVKLGDFGLSKAGTLKTRCGTPKYVAPEVMDGNDYTPAADIWSLGCVLAKLLGCFPNYRANVQTPWPGADWYNLVVGSIGEPPSTGLADVLRSMLVQDPKNRATATEIKEAAGRLIEGTACASTPTQASYAAAATADPRAAGKRPRKTAHGSSDPSEHRHKRQASDDSVYPQTPSAAPSTASSRLSDDFYMDALNPLGGGSTLQSVLRPDLGPDESSEFSIQSLQLPAGSRNEQLQDSDAGEIAEPAYS